MSKLLEKLTPLSIAFNSWNISNSKTVPPTELNLLAKLIKMLGNEPNEKKLTKVLASEEYTSVAAQLAVDLPKAKKSGPLEMLEPKSPGSPLMVSKAIRDDAQFTLVADAYDISKSKYKTLFNVSIDGNLLDKSTLSLLKLIDRKGKEFTDQVNKLFINNERTSTFKLAFKGIFPEENSNLFSLSFVMNKTQKENKVTGETKFELDGYPKSGMRDLSKRVKVIVGGKPKLVPRPIPKADLHETKLHLLFGAGTIVQAPFRIDWSLSESNLRLRVKVAGECIIKPCVINPELATAQRLMDKFGNTDDGDYKEIDENGNVVEGDESSNEVPGNVSDADRLALEALKKGNSDSEEH